MKRPSPLRAFVRIIPIIAILAANAPIGAAQSTEPRISLVAPLTLTQFAIGDSVRFYRLKYERYDRRRVQFGVIGAWVAALGLVAAIPRHCQTEWCTAKPPRAVNKPLVGVGATFIVTGLVFRARAAEAGMRASWWHDASLAR